MGFETQELHGKVSHCCGANIDYLGKFGDGLHYYSQHCLKCQWDAVWLTKAEYEKQKKSDS